MREKKRRCKRRKRILFCKDMQVCQRGRKMINRIFGIIKMKLLKSDRKMVKMKSIIKSLESERCNDGGRLSKGHF